MLFLRFMITSHYYKCGTFLSLWQTNNNNPERLWRIKNPNKDRSDRAERKSVLWIERMLKWHVKYNEIRYSQLLSNFFNKYKHEILKQFGWKHWQLSLEQAHEYQQIVGMLNWQMEASQMYFRKHKKILLYPNSKDRRTYCQQFWITSAMVHLVMLQLTKTMVKRQQLHVKNCKVYHINEIESLGQLCSSIFNYGRFFIQRPLNKNKWLYCSGWDKSVQGLIQTGCLAITKHYHGKYNSLLQTLTSENVAENESNYRELNNHWNKRELTNQMLKFPSMIIISIIHRDDNGQINSKFVQSCVMSLDIESQHAANDQNRETLSQIPSPAVENLNINQNTMQQALNVNNSVSLTATYWQNRSKMFNLQPFLAVSLPNGFKCQSDTTKINISTNDANTRALQLLTIAKSKKYRFQAKHTNDNSNELDINASGINLSDNEDVTISTNGRTQYNLRNRITNDTEHNSNDNDTCMNVNINDYNIDINVNKNNINDKNISSESEYHILDEERHYDTDGEYINDNTFNNNALSDSSDDDTVASHVLHPLCRWNFNQHSRLNRMAQSDWLWKRKHCKASSLHGDRLYQLSFDLISTHIWNVELPMHGTTEIADTLSVESLFNHINGIKFVYLPHEWIPNFSYQELPINYLFGVTLQDLLIGLLQLHITSEEHDESDHLGNNNGCKSYIWQRCAFTDYIDLSCTSWNVENDFKFVNIDNNNQILDEIGNINVNFNNTYDHQIKCNTVDLEMFMQFDNSAKNMCAGITKSTGSNPCSTCEASGQQIYSFPTPITMCFKTRNQLQTVARSLHLNPKQTHHTGCKETPIWDCPVHRYGATTLHDYEGIFKVILDCFKGYLNEYTNGDSLLVSLQDKNEKIHNVYVELTKAQDAKQFLSEQKPVTQHVQTEIDQLTIKINQLQTQYEGMEQKWNDDLQNSENLPLQKYLQILDNHKINEYYCLAGSVQGIMCKRICQARKEIVAIAKQVDKIGGILWELLFENINFLYSMLKHKYHVKYTNFEMASMKHAYIDFYHQLVFVVRSWKTVGDLTIKPHYLLHNLEHALHLRISPAFFDEERIENCHQHVKGMKRLYHIGAGNQHGCREMLVGRRMNDRVLSSG